MIKIVDEEEVDEEEYDNMRCKEEYDKMYLKIIDEVIDYLDEILKDTDIDYEFIEADKDPVFFNDHGFLIIDAIFYKKDKKDKEILLPVLELSLEDCEDGYRITDYRILVRKEDIIKEM
jgi:hypothetical protein